MAERCPKTSRARPGSAMAVLSVTSSSKQAGGRSHLASAAPTSSGSPRSKRLRADKLTATDRWWPASRQARSGVDPVRWTGRVLGNGRVIRPLW